MDATVRILTPHFTTFLQDHLSRIRFNKKEKNSHNGFEYSILIFASHVGGTCSCFKLVTSCLMLF